MGLWEIGLILVIILLVFGVGKLPQVGNAIGKSIREFRKGQIGEGDEAKTRVGHKKQKYAAKPSL
jgi:sec-independent protein translocase protein TatA